MASVEWRQTRHHRAYLEYILIRDLYHCTPTELDNQPKHIVDLHVRIMNMEAEYRWKQEKRAKQ